MDDGEVEEEGGSVYADGPLFRNGSSAGSRVRGGSVLGFGGPAGPRPSGTGAGKGTGGTPAGSVVGRSEAHGPSLARRLHSVAPSQAGGMLPSRPRA